MTKKGVVIAGCIVAVLAVVLVTVIDARNFSQSGVITITGAPQGTLVLLNNKQRARFKSATETITLENLSVDTHTLVLVKDGHWPWTKDIVLANREVVDLTAFLLPQEPFGETIEPEHEDYETASATIKNTLLPTKDAPFTSDDGTTALWVENNTITVAWVAEETPPAAFCILGECTPTLVVLPADRTIRDASFLHTRNDVVVFSAENGIFALELDKRGTQNFQPIYLGTAPEFTFNEDGVLTLQDEDRVLRLRLF